MKAVSEFSGRDRTKIELSYIHLQASKAIKQTGKPLVLLLIWGSVVSFNSMGKTWMPFWNLG